MSLIINVWLALHHNAPTYLQGVLLWIREVDVANVVTGWGEPSGAAMCSHEITSYLTILDFLPVFLLNSHNGDQQWASVGHMKPPLAKQPFSYPTGSTKPSL